MKKIIFIIFLAHFSIIFGQTNDTINKISNENELFSMINAETLPEFPGCQNFVRNKLLQCFNYKIAEHIKQNFIYPSEAAKKNIQGRVSISFIINKKGNVERINITSKSHPLLNNEAYRIVKLLPKMKPATKNGEPVNVIYSLPINFKLQ